MRGARRMILQSTEKGLRSRLLVSWRRTEPPVDPSAYAETAHRICLNILPYEVGSPAVFGFGVWNGRSLIDNAAEVMFSLAANTPDSTRDR